MSDKIIETLVEGISVDDMLKLSLQFAHASAEIKREEVSYFQNQIFNLKIEGSWFDAEVIMWTTEWWYEMRISSVEKQPLGAQPNVTRIISLRKFSGSRERFMEDYVTIKMLV